MSRLIDADALERDGWQMSRTVRVDKNTMEIQTIYQCSICRRLNDEKDNFCKNCGADMRGGQDE